MLFAKDMQHVLHPDRPFFRATLSHSNRFKLPPPQMKRRIGFVNITFRIPKGPSEAVTTHSIWLCAIGDSCHSKDRIPCRTLRKIDGDLSNKPAHFTFGPNFRVHALLPTFSNRERAVIESSMTMASGVGWVVFCKNYRQNHSNIFCICGSDVWNNQEILNTLCL